MNGHPGPDLVEVLRNPERFIQNYPLKTIYLGTVEDANDPDRLNRVRVRVESICPTKTVPTANLPWAYVAKAGGLKFQGGVDIPPNKTAVFVMYLDGDASFPVVIGGFYGINSNESEVPKAARGVADTGAVGKGIDTGTGAQGVAFVEPANPFAAVYPKNHVYRSESGHLIEVDDSTGAERIDIVHGPTGSWLEFHPNGAIVVGCKNKLYVFSNEPTQLHSKKNFDVLAGTDFTARALRDIQTQTTRDDNAVVGRDAITTTTRDWLLTVGRNLTSNTTLATTMSTGTTWSQQAGTTMALQSTTGMTMLDPTTISLAAGAAGSFVAGAAMTITAGAAMNVTAATGLNQACINYLLAATASVSITSPLVTVNSAQVTLGNILPAPVVTTLTHPIDYITGIPILGTFVVRAG